MIPFTATRFPPEAVDLEAGDLSAYPIKIIFRGGKSFIDCGGSAQMRLGFGMCADTFKEAGKVGVWTKADSVVEFDDLTVEGRY